MLKRLAKARSVEDDAEIRAAMAQDEVSWRAAFVFILRLLWRHPVLVAASLLLGVGIAAAEVVSLSLLFPFIGSLSGGGAALTGQTRLAFLVPYFEPYPTEVKIRLIALALVGLQVFKGILGYAAGRVGAYQRILLDRDVRAMVFDQLLDVEMRFINKDKVANFYTILHSYPKDIADVGKELVKGVPRAASFAGYLFAMVLLSWELTIIALVLAAITTRAIGFIITHVRSLSRRINVHRVRLKHITLEALNGLKLIHLFGREEHTRRRFRSQLETYQDTRYWKSSIDAAVSPIYSTLIMAMFAGILIGGTYVLDRSEATWVAVLTMFMVVMFRLMGPTSKYAKTKTKIAGKLPSMEEVMRFLDRDDKPFMADGAAEFRGLRRGLRFEGVSFRYEADEPEVLRDVTFDVPRGATVALVGGSGAGKSTTVDLIARLFDPTAGRITVDGADLRDLRVASWRHRLAVVSQDTFLFNETVRENIRFGRLDATDAEIEEAARQANAHDFILDLPEGYDTMLGERGVRLSGGQAQRVAIARAILADPDVLLLDEATSALDTATERQVQEALDRVARDRTVVAIAHRLSTIRQADTILVMEGGRIVERGTHAELVGRRGHYWNYVQMQRLLDDGDDRSREAPTPAPRAAPQAAAPAAAAPSPNGARAPARSNGYPRLVLTAGALTARFKAGGGPGAEVRLRGLVADESVDDVLEKATDDVAIWRVGDSRATVRVNGDTHRDVPMFQAQRNGASGATEEVRVRVRGAESAPAR